MNSASTEESSFIKIHDIKEKSDCDEPEDDGFKEIKEKKKLRENSILKDNSYHCFVRNLFEKFGSLFISDKNNSRMFVSRLRIVNFPMNKDIFERGKVENSQYFNVDSASLPELKFWHQRYYYYSKFDEGIKMDYESWYSVTPEELAKYIALAITNKKSVVVDAFCGSGGNVIQFSKYCKYVYAIDIDPTKIEICNNNCKVYNCDKNVEFIVSDYLDMENKIKADFIFLSPPWGGVEYKHSEFYSIKKMMTPDIYEIIKVCLTIGKKIIFYMPRTILLTEFFDILDDIIKEEDLPRTKDVNSINTYNHIYVDIHILNSANKIKAVLLVFGNDIEEISHSDINKYLSFQYKTLNDDMLSKLININKVIGNARFLRTEYSFRKNNKANIIKDTNSSIKTLINFFKDEILNDQELILLKRLNKQSLIKKGNQESICNHDYNIKFPWKNKSYFVNNKIMSEHEFIKFRDDIHHKNIV